jgi:23S rRNA (cytosine1962-C5)-methyltransferase
MVAQKMAGAKVKPVPRLRLRVSGAAERMLRAGHPWVFADSIREANRQGGLGEIGVVYDRNDRLLALGLFDPISPIRLRVLQLGKRETLDHAWWSRRLKQALARRHGLLGQETTGYRLINGESDGWPGLVLDRYDRSLVIKLYSGAWLPRLAEITSVIVQELKPDRIVERLSRHLQANAETNNAARDGQVLWGSALAGPVVFLESGLKFEADIQRGQKTGFFLDQRENRGRVERLAAGRSVLNAFSFSGGFSNYAARGGAQATLDLDISGHALASSKRNFELNKNVAAIAACHKEWVKVDVFNWLAANHAHRFGMVILDPPSLAKRESDKSSAISAYTQLAAMGIRHVTSGGILVASSCSAHVTAAEFFAAVRQAAAKSRRRFEEIETTRHAPDHPADFKEAEYLKTIYLRLNK